MSLVVQLVDPAEQDEVGLGKERQAAGKDAVEDWRTLLGIIRLLLLRWIIIRLLRCLWLGAIRLIALLTRVLSRGLSIATSIALWSLIQIILK